jgi:membrane-associated protein
MDPVAAPAFADPNYLVETFGMIGLVTIIFSECALLVGFFLPGDGLLFTAGFLLAQGVLDLPLWALLILLATAAVAGNLVGYWIGYRAGPLLYERPNSRLFKRKHLERSHDFLERHGPFTIVLARFVPIVRTFVTVIAGASRMRFSTYATYSVVGALLWAAGMPALGYYIGGITFVRERVELFALGIAAVSTTPLWVGFLRKRRLARQAAVG